MTHEEEVMLLKHECADLRGNIVRLLDDNVQLLLVAASALKRNRVAVVQERIEVATENMQNMLTKLKSKEWK